MTTNGLLSRLGREECLALISTQHIGRLAFTRRALPDLIPVNFILSGSDVLIRLERTSSVAAAVRDAVVAFEVDNIDPVARSGWSVTVVGQARPIDPAGRYGRPLPEPWAPGVRDELLRIDTDRVAGR
jgi:uncharacterized protein